jgi:hypothetical protein
MRYTFLTLSAILASAFVTLSWPVRAAEGDDKPPAPGKSSALAVEEGVKALKTGIFKLKEAEVLSLFGPPTSVKRAGAPAADLELQWKYSTHIFGTFKDGKLFEVSGAFSEQLPVERITFANFKRLRLGMAEGEVVEILGKGNGTTKVDGAVTRSWGTAAELQVSLSREGRLAQYELKQNSAAFFPAGVAIPGLPNK